MSCKLVCCSARRRTEPEEGSYSLFWVASGPVCGCRGRWMMSAPRDYSRSGPIVRLVLMNGNTDGRDLCAVAHLSSTLELYWTFNRTLVVKSQWLKASELCLTEHPKTGQPSLMIARGNNRLAQQGCCLQFDDCLMQTEAVTFKPSCTCAERPLYCIILVCLRTLHPNTKLDGEPVRCHQLMRPLVMSANPPPKFKSDHNGLVGGNLFWGVANLQILQH